MIVQLLFKTPDAVDRALDEYDFVPDGRELAEEVIKKFVRDGEYVKIEIDINSGEAKVLPA